ncbi:AsnC family transcriptional regulator [Dechloromonas denitrificans]|uniref:siroheme decarboxylase subunit beta n=1 Tax=Dechloromonas denitrificans TaxID=281362 RepID=UPI001CF871D6|nr:AsnC family transcriptional regulator [Dechloromonas denitrificans]UCV12422.1 AsnC family transcriptional regulator [Dechloromonas denitrificans]
MDTIDRQLVLATQGGLPLVARPYARLAEQLGLSEADVMLRLQGLLDRGLIRRIGVVPNHYAIGWTANGMTVWNVPDDKVDELGGRVGALPFVTHCYRRPRALPAWPYNLFAMVHGSSREECSAKADDIRRLLGEDCLGNDVLYSTRILKKTGLRIGG